MRESIVENLMSSYSLINKKNAKIKVKRATREDISSICDL